jgi:5-methylcytosine-specific restriction enzyme subunit McrC
LTPTIEIDELDRDGVVVSLTHPERLALQRAQHQLGVEWRPDGTARVFSQGSVGTVALSSDKVIRVVTKVPVGNLLSLTSLAYRTLSIPPSVGDALNSSSDFAADWLALVLALEAQRLIAHGMRQGYVLMRDELPYIRGRILFDSLIQARPSLTRCEYTDYLPDTPENRLLRAALESLATRRLLTVAKLVVESVLPHFYGVTLVPLTPRLLDSCRITRLNEHYRPAVDLCQLLIYQSGIEGDVGTLRTPAFFFPMSKVFEKALLNLFRETFRDLKQQSGKTFHPAAGSGPSVSFAADIIVGDPPRIVIDTKYVDPELHTWHGARFDNTHIYQVAFYSRSLRCPALLVYPRSVKDVDVTFDFDGTAVSIKTVDLREQGLGSLRQLAASVAQVARPVVAA